MYVLAYSITTYWIVNPVSWYTFFRPILANAQLFTTCIYFALISVSSLCSFDLMKRSWLNCTTALKVMEVAKTTLDAGQEISTELMAKLLKFQLLCMKTSDLQRVSKLKVRWAHTHSSMSFSGQRWDECIFVSRLLLFAWNDSSAWRMYHSSSHSSLSSSLKYEVFFSVQV